jgi:hypothetical protein
MWLLTKKETKAVFREEGKGAHRGFGETRCYSLVRKTKTKVRYTMGFVGFL